MPTHQPDPYYQDDHVTIYHGDSLELLPHITAESAHAVISDPPYFNTVDEDWDKQWGNDPAAFLRWLGTILDQCNRVLDARGTLAIFCAPDMSCAVETEVRRRFNYMNHIVWRKPGPGRAGRMDKESMRRFFPTSERIILAEKSHTPEAELFRFIDRTNHTLRAEVHIELIERLVELRNKANLTNTQIDEALGRRGMASHYFGKSQWALPTVDAWHIISQLLTKAGIDPPPHEELRGEFESRRGEFESRRREFESRRGTESELFTDVWTFSPPSKSERFSSHPTPKPVSLMAHLVGAISRTQDTILDPFMGTGSTLRAAKDLNRRAIGIELEEKYCEIAAQRCAQEVLPW